MSPAHSPFKPPPASPPPASPSLMFRLTSQGESHGESHGHAQHQGQEECTRRHGHSVKYDAITGGKKGDSSIQSTMNTLSKVTEQPVKTRTRSTGLQVCLPDCSNSSKTNSYKKAVSLSPTSRSYCNYLYTFFSQL